jgi:hypothetical protein
MKEIQSNLFCVRIPTLVAAREKRRSDWRSTGWADFADAIAMRAARHGKFASVVKQVVDGAPGVPLIQEATPLIEGHRTARTKTVDPCGDRRKREAMAKIERRPLAVSQTN